VIEHLVLEDEKASIDPDAAVINRVDICHQIAIALLQGNRVVAEVGAHAKKAGTLSVLAEMLQLLGKVQIRQTIAIIGEEHLLPFHVFLDGFQALSDIGVDPGIGKVMRQS